MGEWRTSTLGDLAELGFGKTPPRADNHFWGKDHGHPWATIADLRDDPVVSTTELVSDTGLPHAGRVVPAGGVMMSFKLTVGRVARAGTDLLTNEAIVSVSGKPSVADDGWLYHALPAIAAQGVTDTAVKGATLNKFKLERLRTPVPPLEEQRRIAEILDSIDETIQATERVIAKLAMLRDGIRSSLIDQAQGSWQRVAIKEIGGGVTSGSRGWASYYAESGEVFLRIANLTREHPNLRRLDETMFVRPPRGSEEERTRCEPGDLLISITADLGIIGVIPPSIPRSYVNQHIARVRINPDLANIRFVAHSLQSPTGQRQFDRLNDSGAKAGLNLPAVASLSLRIPNLAVQRAVADQIDEVQGRIDVEGRSVRKLRRTRAGLASDLLSGRVRTAAA